MSLRRTTSRSLIQGAVAGLAAILTVLAAAAILRRGSPPSPPPPVQADSAVASVPPAAVLHPDILSVTAAFPAGDGWLLLDGRAARVHRVDARGRHVLAFGRRGQGPGEMEVPAGLLILGDTVLVGERTGGRIHRFGLAGDYLGGVSILPAGCLGAGLLKMAVMGPVPLFLFQCLNQERRGSFAGVYALEDTLSLLASLPLRDHQRGSMSPFRMPVLAAHRNGFFLGVTTEPCLSEFDRRGEPTGQACHPWSEPVPLPAEERARLMALRRRLDPGLGGRLEIPEALPPFDRAFSPGGKVVFLTTRGMNARSLDALEGGALRRVPVPATPDTFVGDSSALVTWERVDGTWIAVYRLGR